MKYALITGGSRGIGRAIAIKLAALGYPILLNYKNNKTAANEVAEQIKALGQQVELLPFDVADADSVKNAMNLWMTNHPNDYIDILINNAGVRNDSLLTFMEDEQWNDVLNTTLNGFFYTTRAVIKNMILKRHGRIINISSISGISGLPGQVNYSSAKAALIGAVKALSKEVATRKITVNAIAPGFIESDMTKDLNETELKKTIPAGRFGKPEEVASLVEFLVSDNASYITGQVIAIAGGMG
ncbi:MAG: 3-oxoacyl-ACP reductase FabG [Paludibacteraceae bacterium]|nr:3-oxoacyl-ACP reductase FabG [Paludibacteraceae bacterium]